MSRDDNKLLIQSLWKNSKFAYFTKKSDGKSGGIIAIWDPSCFSSSSAIEGDGFVAITGKWRDFDTTCLMIVVYAPQDHKRKEKLWRELNQIINQHNIPSIVFGDFNEVRNASERLGSIFDATGASMFNKFIFTLGLCDLPMGGKRFTRMDSIGSKLSKIDRILVSKHFVDLWPYSYVTALTREFSDHTPLLLSNSITDYGPTPFKLYNSWISHIDFRPVGVHMWSILLSTLLLVSSQNSSTSNLPSGNGDQIFRVWSLLQQLSYAENLMPLITKLKWVLLHPLMLLPELILSENSLPWNAQRSWIFVKKPRILTCFNLTSGLKINFHKSKLYGVGVTTLEVNSLASMIGCLPSKFPCTYLGLPIGGNMSRCANWGILVDKFNERLSNWKAMSLSFGGRFTLIKSVLGSLGVYYFSTFKAPNKIINKLEGIRRKFFWGGTTDEKKIAWIAWDKATSPISNGGLGIGTLKSSNLAMLSKWWWRFHTENHAFWCKIIRSIHGVDGGLNDTSLIKSKSGPWYRIAKLKDELSKIGIDLPSIFKKKIGDGCSTRFWLDTWLGGSPLKDTFPRLFRLDSNPAGLVLCNLCPTFPSGFPTCLQLLLPIPPLPQLPPVSLIFNLAWEQALRTTNKRLPTKANLDYRGIDLDSVRCPMCDDSIETEDHIFVSCPIAKDTWKCIADWWNIPNITIANLLEGLNLADTVPITAN
ncbi:reverse transcriptase domain, reverse transcriptase zinc-binding domain protein [Tanacetum coccineum]